MSWRRCLQMLEAVRQKRIAEIKATVRPSPESDCTFTTRFRYFGKCFSRSGG